MHVVGVIEISSPKHFEIPTYDFQVVRQIASSTNLDAFYNHLLRGTSEYPAHDFTYGIHPQIVKSLHERIINGFDWEEWVNKIEAMGKHYTVDVKGLDGEGETSTMHFVHSPSTNKDAIPLILVHGWPGSFLEFEAILPHLKSDYHVVMPSMTGYPFSSPQRQRGNDSSGGPQWSLSAFAESCHKLMLVMGYQAYVAQGGDTGHLVVRRLAQLFRKHCVAVHLNNAALLGGDPGALMGPDQKIEDLTDDEKRGLARWEEFQTKGTAYFMMHGTVPYTVGAVLCTSPLATIFWLSEKIYRWSSPNTAPSLDFALATCLLYWFSGSIPSCIWHYFLMVNKSEDMGAIFKEKIYQPAAIGIGRYDFGWPSRKAFEQVFPNLRSWRILEEGGHFAAHEVPQLLVADFNELFKSKEVIDAVQAGGRG